MAYPQRLEDLIEGKGGNYILPFFWMHGEDKEIIKEEIDKVCRCGIREICLESRPHPDFAGPGWWEDLDFIMEEAKKRELRIWILDDDKFPTGHANGAFEKHPELAKVYLAQRHMDVVGPVKDSAVVIAPFLGDDGELLAVLACPKPDTESLDIAGDGILDLTGQVQNGVLYFDVPQGYYRIFVLYKTRKNGGRENYMNLLDSRSVKVLIDTVYEPHYQRYQKEFGKTFAGFFSDEPELGNTPGYDFQDRLGKCDHETCSHSLSGQYRKPAYGMQGYKCDVKLPWSSELESRLGKLWGSGFCKNLPALWYDMGEKTSGIRSVYMDSVTSLVSSCFSGQVGNWCRERGIEYIGHIIEDDNAHGRLGCSIGHYFRAQTGQDMSGIDVVLLQIMPGFTGTYHQWIASDRDGEFFHYGLAKLGSSYAHIDPAKKGRALCEIYGAYGWGEGISLMKWLTDHMLVRGINVFVPHAFSPAFPDRDCPPHFYARGNNPQYRFFTLLMKYMNRCCHLLNGGIHRADAAILYHAEAEWTGKEAMLFQKPVRKLLEHQLDADVVPADWLVSCGINTPDAAEADNKTFRIGNAEYTSFIIPYCASVPKKAVDFAIRASKKGIPVYMVGGCPSSLTDGSAVHEEFAKCVTVVSLEELPGKVRETGKPCFSFTKSNKDLRALCYRQKDANIYMFFNESPFETVDTSVRFLNGERRYIIRYDGINNETEPGCFPGEALPLHLLPGESAIYLESDSAPDCKRMSREKVISLDIDWDVSLSKPDEYPAFQKRMHLPSGQGLPNMNGKNGFPEFSGTFLYEGKFDYGDTDGKAEKYMLRLPAVGDCAEVWLNGSYAGMMIGNPYEADITSYIKKGQNLLRIEIANTLVWKMHDGQSTHMQLSPTGLLAPPQLHLYR